MNRDRFQTEMARLGIAYGQAPNNERWLVYWDRLQTVSDETFGEAVKRVMDTERFFPTIATLHGHCDRVKAEAAARQQSAMDDTPRLRRGDSLPDCATCLDSGWITTANPLSNLPSTLTKCPDCAGQVKGRDAMFHFRQRDAFMYLLDREHAHYPKHEARPLGPEGIRSAIAGVAAGLRMQRSGEVPRGQEHDTEGAFCRWSPPAPMTRGGTA